MTIAAPLLAVLDFEKTAHLPIILFEVFVLGASLAGFFIMRQLTDKVGWRLLATGCGVLIFELFTGPMWLNARMGPWAYIFNDLSWILTVGWTFLILGVVLIVDHFLPGWRAPQRFAVYLFVSLVLVVFLETLVVALGIRSYGPEVVSSLSGAKLLGAPIEILYYVPVFTALIITFYKYWSFMIDGVLLIPIGQRRWKRGILLAFIAVFLFEVMIEPMIENRNFPAWSYVYHDISVIMTGMWVLLIGLVAVFMERFFLRLPMWTRFVLSVMLIGAIALPIESWLNLSGYRVYGPSMVARFTGFTNPVTGLPSEICFAIPCYMSLIVAFIRYWEIVLDNDL